MRIDKQTNKKPKIRYKKNTQKKHTLTTKTTVKNHKQINIQNQQTNTTVKEYIRRTTIVDNINCKTGNETTYSEFFFIFASGQ